MKKRKRLTTKAGGSGLFVTTSLKTGVGFESLQSEDWC